MSYLDLELKKVNRRIDIRLFDKRDAFPFSIVRLPYASSNMPTNIFYSSISVEVLRIGRICSNFDNFISSMEPVIVRAFKQGAHVKGLEKSLKKIYGRHEILKGFGANAQLFANVLVSLDKS